MKRKLPKLSLHLRSDFFRMLLKVVGGVCVWRGLWHLMDLYLFPGNYLLSSIFSLALGLFILYLPDDDIKELI